MESKCVSIKMTETALVVLDNAVVNSMCQNRADFIRTAIREKISREMSQ